MRDKYVLLTGGTGGLGTAVTHASLAVGAKIVTLPYRSQSSADRLKARLLEGDLERVRLVQADLSDEVAVEKLVNNMGQVDILIHVMGGFSMGRTDEFSYQDWQKLMNLNLNSAFLTCKHTLRRMRQTGYGRIVVVGARAAVLPAPQLAAYSASKAGLVALIQSIAEETKDIHTDITANAVLPSVIDTPKNREAMGEQDADVWVKPESLAQVICFLASEAARDIRGAAVPVYGKA